MKLPRKYAGSLSVLLAIALAGCAGDPPPAEVTDDGLTRVPARASGGVYRRIDASFTQYRRVMLEPLVVEFSPEWRKRHPEIEDRDLRRIQDEAIRHFREKFVEVLVDEGPYKLAELREPDVLIVVPRMLDLDIPAPEGTRSYVPHPIRMQVNGELRDAVSGALLMRVIMFDGQKEYGYNELRLANRATNAHEMRGSFGKWARLVREALDVAKVARPRPEATAAPR